MDNYKKNFEKIRKLEDGWDGENSKKFDKNFVDKIENIVSEIVSIGFNNPYVDCESCGDIYAEFKIYRWEIFVVFTLTDIMCLSIMKNDQYLEKDIKIDDKKKYLEDFKILLDFIKEW